MFFKNFLTSITSLKPVYRRFILICFDILFIILSFFISFSIFNIDDISYNYWILNSSIFLGLIIFLSTGQYETLTKYYSSSYFYKIIIRNIILITTIFLFGVIFELIFPIKNIILQGIFIIFFVSFSRIVFRDILLNQSGKENKKKINVAIFGAGSAGVQLAASLRLSNKYNIICFLDDANYLSGRQIYGIAIYPPDKLNKNQRNKIDQILLAIPSLQNEDRRKLIRRLHKFGKKVLQTPSIEDITTGIAKINNLIPIDIEDLLGRDPIEGIENLLTEGIFQKTICITGAGGSIGSELSRQVANLKPFRLILIDSSEPSLYKVSEEIKNKYKDQFILDPIIGNITNQVFLDNLFKSIKVDSVFHAAAYKHVPLVELNPLQGIENNVLSTLALCKACEKNNTPKMLLISTDKAVRPFNVMGASKRVAELLVQAFSKKKSNTCFSMVRFGNVLNSNGSVVPLFKKQIREGGPITITHREINRYFMTIPEAASLVIQSSFLAKGGEVFLLDMGEPVKISSLAKQLIQLSGLKIKNKENPNGDIEIKYVGLRPGEKLYEELLVDGKSEPTQHPLIFKVKEELLNEENFWINIEDLIGKIKIFDKKKVLEILIKLVPEWQSSYEKDLKI